MITMQKQCKEESHSQSLVSSSASSTAPKYLSEEEQNYILRQLHVSLLISLTFLKLIAVFAIAMGIFFFTLFVYRMPPVHIQQVQWRDWFGRVQPSSRDLSYSLHGNQTSSSDPALSYIKYLKALEEEMKDKIDGKKHHIEEDKNRSKLAEMEVLTSLHGLKDLLGNKHHLLPTSGCCALLMTVGLFLWSAWNTFRAQSFLFKCIQKKVQAPITGSSSITTADAVERGGSLPGTPIWRHSLTMQGVVSPPAARGAGLTMSEKGKEEHTRTEWQTSPYWKLVLRHHCFIVYISTWPAMYWLLALQRYHRDRNVEMKRVGLPPSPLYLGITDRAFDLLLAVWPPFFHLLVWWMISAIGVSANDLDLLYGLRYDVDKKSL